MISDRRATSLRPWIRTARQGFEVRRERSFRPPRSRGTSTPDGLKTRGPSTSTESTTAAPHSASVSTYASALTRPAWNWESPRASGRPSARLTSWRTHRSSTRRPTWRITPRPAIPSEYSRVLS